jgi:hypothetical protein
MSGDISFRHSILSGRKQGGAEERPTEVSRKRGIACRESSRQEETIMICPGGQL